MKAFQVVAGYEPAGDQPQAIAALTEGILRGDKFQTLKGITGSGKTFTMAKIIEAVQRPTLVISHNKTLAAQLYREFKNFFPGNAVEYFVSYYDYYQPEAYVPARDLYIEKDAAINDEIDRMRLSATFSLMERRDVLVVASVVVEFLYGGEFCRHVSRALVPRVGELDKVALAHCLERALVCQQDAHSSRLGCLSRYARAFKNTWTGRFPVACAMLSRWRVYAGTSLA